GYPLYYPEPLDNLSLELRKRGISIGDVGHVTPEGRFHFAFNIFTPQTNTAINHFGTPIRFHHLVLRDISRSRNKHPEKSALKIEGKSTTSPVEFKINYNFATSTSESALLTMPHGAMGEDYDRIKDIRAYSIENAPSWYTFINGTLGREAPNGSLYVVTGCDKSATWGIATNAEIQMSH
ncbi:hypothetical protein FIBSPDRAFT_750151, partial [Athelia psychrophila]